MSIESITRHPSGLWRVAFSDSSEVWVPDYRPAELEATANARQVSVDAFRAVADVKRKEPPPVSLSRPKGVRAKLTKTSRRTNGPEGEPIPSGPKIGVELTLPNRGGTLEIDGEVVVTDLPPEIPARVSFDPEWNEPSEAPTQVAHVPPYRQGTSQPVEPPAPVFEGARMCECGHAKRRHAKGACTVYDTQFDICPCIRFKEKK